MTDFVLYYSPGACSLAAHVALIEVGLPFTLERVSTKDKETQRPEFLAINPKGRVPVLRIPGEPSVLTELPAILGYVSRLGDGHGLMPPAEPLAAARIAEWLNWLSGWVHGQGFGLIWRPQRFNQDPASHPALEANGRRIVEGALDTIDERLSRTGPYATGERYSIVDPFLLVLFRWGNLIGLDVPSRHPAWAKQTAMLLARPAVLRALEEECLDVADWKIG